MEIVFDDTYDHSLLEHDPTASMANSIDEGRGSSCPCQILNSGDSRNPADALLTRPPAMVTTTVPTLGAHIRTWFPIESMVLYWYRGHGLMRVWYCWFVPLFRLRIVPRDVEYLAQAMACCAASSGWCCFYLES